MLQSLESVLHMEKACVDELQVKVEGSSFFSPLLPSSGAVRGCS